jgi:hypothetical protein
MELKTCDICMNDFDMDLINLKCCKDSKSLCLCCYEKSIKKGRSNIFNCPFCRDKRKVNKKNEDKYIMFLKKLENERQELIIKEEGMRTFTIFWEIDSFLSKTMG